MHVRKVMASSAWGGDRSIQVKQESQALNQLTALRGERRGCDTDFTFVPSLMFHECVLFDRGRNSMAQLDTFLPWPYSLSKCEG